MIIKWRTGRQVRIDRVECSKETAQSVWISVDRYGDHLATPQRASKLAQYHAYHDTWEAARDFLLKQAEAEVTQARRQLERANGKLGNVKGLRKPEDA